MNQEEQITQSEWMNKWLSNIKEELNDVFEVLITIKRYQHRVLNLIGAWLLETTFNKILNSELLEFIKMKYLGDFITINILSSRISQFIRLSLGFSCSRLWLKSLITYKSPEDIVKNEIKELRKLLSNSQQWVLKTVKHDNVLTLEDYVATYNSEASSEGSYVESDISSDTYYSGSLGSDSEDLVDEYLEELANSRRNRRRQFGKRNLINIY